METFFEENKLHALKINGHESVDKTKFHFYCEFSDMQNKYQTLDCSVGLKHADQKARLQQSTTVVQIKTCVFPHRAALSDWRPQRTALVDPPRPSQTPHSRLSPSCRCGPVTILDFGADGDTAEETARDDVEPKGKAAAVCTFSV